MQVPRYRWIRTWRRQQLLTTVKMFRAICVIIDEFLLLCCGRFRFIWRFSNLHEWLVNLVEVYFYWICFVHDKYNHLIQTTQRKFTSIYVNTVIGKVLLLVRIAFYMSQRKPNLNTSRKIPYVKLCKCYYFFFNWSAHQGQVSSSVDTALQTRGYIRLAYTHITPNEK